MFGYIRIFKPQLRVCEYEAYRAVYCTLCRELGKQYGVFSRALLSYDYTFVTLLYMAMHNQPPEYKSGRCVFNPCKRCGVCECGREGFNITAAMTAVMFYYKTVDNIRDSGFFRGLLWRAAKLAGAVPHRRAAKRHPELEELVKKCMESQSLVESNPGASLDEAAEPTAVMVSGLAQMLSDSECDKRVLKDFGYYLGRWIYLIDAADDLEKDIKRDEFNPIARKFSLNRDSLKNAPDELSKAREYANECLNMTLARAITSYQLLNLGDYAPILDNVIYLGMSRSQRETMHEKELQS